MHADRSDLLVCSSPMCKNIFPDSELASPVMAERLMLPIPENAITAPHNMATRAGHFLARIVVCIDEQSQQGSSLSHFNACQPYCTAAVI